MARTLAEVDEALAEIETRTNAIDGQNLSDEAEAELAKLRRAVNGLKTTLRQVTLTIQTDLNNYRTEVANLKTQLTTHLTGS